MNLSLLDLQNHLQNHFSTPITLTSIDPHLIGLGRGYLSNVFSVGLEWSVDEGTLSASVVVKELNLQILAPELNEATGLPKAKDSQMSLSGFDKVRFILDESDDKCVVAAQHGMQFLRDCETIRISGTTASVLRVQKDERKR